MTPYEKQRAMEDSCMIDIVQFENTCTRLVNEMGSALNGAWSFLDQSEGHEIEDYMQAILALVQARKNRHANHLKLNHVKGLSENGAEKSESSDRPANDQPFG